MCQLTLYSFNKDFDMNTDEVRKDIRNLLYITSVINSQNHPDGHGVNFVSAKSGRNFVIKSERSGLSGEVVRAMDKKNLDLTSPIIFHVRKASTRYAKEPNHEANTHPFEGEEFILAHNGTFSGEHITENKDKTIIDSRIFHRELEKNWKEKGEKDKLLDVLQKTYEDFSGKMALLFRQKSTGDVFVVKNDRAELHKTALKYKGKVVGFVLNTEVFSMYNTNNLSQRFTDFTFDLKVAPKEIEDLTLYKVGEGDLEQVGRIHEYISKITPSTVKSSKNSSKGVPISGSVTNTSGLDLSWLIKQFIPVTNLSIPEVNLLFTIAGFPLPYINSRKQYLKAEKKIKAMFNSYYRKAKKEIIEEIYDAGVTLQEFHQKYAFPYFILSVKELKEIKKEVMHG